MSRRSNFYMIKRIPKMWEKWSDINHLWNYPSSDVEFNYNSWEFNIWNLDHQQLMTLSFLIIHSYNFPATFSIRTDTWYNLMNRVQALMGTHENPYHNFQHVMDVFQSCNAFVREFDARSWLNDLQVFSLLIACLVHDLEHPGTNNIYQVNAGTVLALRYNDMSVLENHHCSRAFELFHQPGHNIFAALSLDQRKTVRKYIIAMVLATDMSVHFSLKEELESCVGKVIALRTAGEMAKIEDKDVLTIMKAVIHTADISNPAKRWAMSKKWSDRVIQEFFEQGDREKREHLPISMNCDRHTTDQDELSINFTDFIVAPFYFSITKLLPAAMKACCLLEDNRNAWNTLLTQRLHNLQAEGKKETIVKWESRQAAFTERMKDLQAVGAVRVDETKAMHSTVA